jgi:hypothetical protein
MENPASYRFISQKTNDRTMLTISHVGPLAERECVSVVPSAPDIAALLWP